MGSHFSMCLATNRSLPEAYVYSTDRYYYLLKNYNGIFAYLFWMRRTREKSVTPSLRNYKKNQKERLLLIQEIHSRKLYFGI